MIEKVGEGSYGEVYRARDTWLDREVALKLLKPMPGQEAALLRILHEARTLARVRHPNVVTVHGADIHDGRVGLWMEFVPGRTLEDALQTRERFTVAEAALIGQELCQALAAVHAAGLVHRDVKTRNVIREDGGRVVLMDFGAGQARGLRMSDKAAPTGTPVYLAPEVLNGGDASVQSDIYALGVLLYRMATKDVAFGEAAETDGALRELARTSRSPSPLKRLKGARRVPLEAPDASGELAATLLSRRTWRRFGAEPVSRAQLATLLGLTWGVQRWAATDGQGTVALKTAPSGGARHNLEAYVLVRHVTGVPSGLYHYDPNGHVLQCMRSGVPAAISSYVPNQTWYDHAACVVFMSAVFARAQWRYHYARAYRSVFLEAGHFCQTFCLVATRLGLAPFCTAAFADSRLERDLGIDGVTESAIYSCGVGTRPPGVEWAPWPDRDDVPTVYRPTCRRRRARSTGPARKSGR